MAEEVKEIFVAIKGRKHSKVVAKESEDSIEIPKIKMKRVKKQKEKSKALNKTMEFLEVMVEIQKIQSKTTEAIAKISNSESDEKVTKQFQGLIKMIRSKTF